MPEFTDIHERILETAERLFYSEGTRAVGIDRVIEETSVAKATLYRHFRSKDALIESYLEARHRRIIKSLYEAHATPAGDARQKILQIFEDLAGKADRPEFRGCAFLMAVAENENKPAIIRVAREHKAQIRALFHRLASTFSSNPATLSEDLALCYEGALATISVTRGPEGALTAGRIAKRLIAMDEDKNDKGTVPETRPRS
jgi:AcrR family transcriptional regulator